MYYDQYLAMIGFSDNRTHIVADGVSHSINARLSTFIFFLDREEPKPAQS